MLVQLWVAQGYIDSKDEGWDCFKRLWWRSFFQDVETDKFENVVSCRMHDLMHDLSDSITGEKIIRTSPRATSLRNITSKTRHLSLFKNEEDHDDSIEEVEINFQDDQPDSASQVRTLMCDKVLSEEERERVLHNFSRLRVLATSVHNFTRSNVFGPSIDGSTQFHYIGSLKHLRYLALEYLEKLPDSITSLLNLQVLWVKYGRLKELPRDIRKLTNLKHLHFYPEKLTHIPKGIGELQFLETLPIFVVCNNDKMVEEAAGLEELEGLNALCGELIIKNLANVECIRRNSTNVYVLRGKLLLQSLILDWGRFTDYYDTDLDNSCTSTSSDETESRKRSCLIPNHDEEVLKMLWPNPNLKKLEICGGYGGIKLPNWMVSVSTSSLVELSLRNCMNCEYLPSLHKIASLRKLKLKHCPQLKGINIDGRVDDTSFICLASLNIEDCPQLTIMPTFPTVEGKLKMSKASLQPLARTMRMEMRTSEEGAGADRGGGCPRPKHDLHKVKNDEIRSRVTLDSGSASECSVPLDPLRNLEELKLRRINDQLHSLPDDDGDDFMRSPCLESLRKLTLWFCPNMGRKMPSSLCSSRILTTIKLYRCESLEFLPPLNKLPSLKRLSISNCWELKGCWWRNLDEEDEEWPHFPCLSELEIYHCPELTRIPLFPTVQGRLKLRGTSSRPLLRTMTMKLPDSSSSSSPPPLCKVTELVLWGMDDLECLPDSGLCNLSNSLVMLWIERCPRLASLPPTMRRLTCLQQLYISECPQLAGRCRPGEGEDWPYISHVPAVTVRPEMENQRDTSYEYWDD